MQDKLVGNKGENGQLLVEAMVAMGVITVGVLGIFTLLSQSLGYSKVISDQYVGSYLAAEGIEVVKNMIDANVPPAAWNAGLNVDGDYAVYYGTTTLDSSISPNTPLKFDPSSGTYNYTTGTATGFKRDVYIKNIPDSSDDGLINEIEVKSTVTWTDRGGIQQEVDVEDHFMNWHTGS